MEAEGGEDPEARKTRAGRRTSPPSASAVEAELELVQRTWDEFKDLHARKIIDDELLWRELRDRYGDYFEGGMGADAIKRLIDRIDFDVEERASARRHRPAGGQEAAVAPSASRRRSSA